MVEASVNVFCVFSIFLRRKEQKEKNLYSNQLLEVPIIISIIATCKSTWTVSLKLDH